MKVLLSILAMVLCLGMGQAIAQTSADSTGTKGISVTDLDEGHSPRKAAKYSAMLPGLGQYYNRKYWKIPILYAGGGLLFYFIRDNNQAYKRYRNALEIRRDTNNMELDQYVGIYNSTQLQTLRDGRRRDRDFTVILSVLAYIINILDAYVDAHLMEFDMSDDLTLKIQPALIPTSTPFQSDFGQARPAAGLTFHFQLH